MILGSPRSLLKSDLDLLVRASPRTRSKAAALRDSGGAGIAAWSMASWHGVPSLEFLASQPGTLAWNPSLEFLARNPSMEAWEFLRELV